MMVRRFAAGAALVWCAAAYGNDKPAIAPPPPWVTPRPIPTDDGKLDGAAIRVLMNDQQANFARDGVSAYTEIVLKIQTPQGLAAGNVDLPWNPDLDTLAVHKLVVIRAGKTIDVLAKQSFVVLRREPNLERATLDGMLTASLQPEGLQVGDVIDLALSVKHHDPALGDHLEGLFAFGADARTDEAALAARWPAAIPIRWHARPGLPAIVERSGNGVREAGFAPQPLAPLTLPKRAPFRYGIVRQAEFTDLPDWSAAAAILAPAYARAATLQPDGALATEAEKIAAATADPKARAAAALALVQDQVRYLAIFLAGGGLVPPPADTSWSRRYGDCKGKTVMLVGLLRALGIDAVPVLVSATGGDGLDQRLPMLGVFDHVLVRATIAGRTYWLDGTRQGDHDLDAIETPPFHWGLPLLARGATLVSVMPRAPDRPYATTTLSLDARAGIDKPAPAHATSIVRGDVATALHVAIDNLAPEQRDAGLREYWRNIYAAVTPTAVTARYDRTTGEETLTLDGSAAMDWSGGGYETDGTGVGYTADFTREPGADRDAPFAVAFPSYTRTTETIQLPDRGKGFTLDDATLDRTIAGIAYHRTGALKDGVVMLERTVRSVAPEFPASEAAAAQATLTALGRKAVYVRPPERSDTTGGAVSPTQQKVAAAYKLLAAQHPAEAAAAYDAVIKSDPGIAGAYVGRGLAYAQLGRLTDARADLDKAVSVSPRDPRVLADHGSFALSQGDHDQAISDAAVAIALAPDEPSGYLLRARTHYAAGDYEKVRGDAEHAITIAPSNVDAYLLLANALRSGGHAEEALAVASRLTAANPDNDYAHVVAGAIYGRFHRDQDAAREFDRAIAIKPSPYVYLTRLEYRPMDDISGRQADIDAAHKLDPGNPAVAAQQARLDDRSGHPEKAIPTLSELLRQEPGNVNALVSRGIAYSRLGRDALADADFVAARKATSSAVQLNEICWRKATANVALQSALTDCDASLATEPGNSATLDSRGFVLMRLKRWDDSIAAYDRVLAIRPGYAAALYGRSLAKQGKGDVPGTAADRSAALKADPDIVETFAGYGLVAGSSSK